MAYEGIYLVIFLLTSALKCSYQDVIDHRGKEFVISYIAQHPIQSFTGENVIFLSSFEDVKVRIRVPFLHQQLDQQHNVSAGNVSIISLPGKTRMGFFTRTRNKGVRITANKPISVYGLQKNNGKGEGFIGLPVDFLGKYYIVSTLEPAISAVVQVTATEDNTKVSIRLKLPEGGRVMFGEKEYLNGDFINTTLNDLDVFQVLGDSDLSGTTVTSSKAVAVFSGDLCAMEPQYTYPCNQLVEQIPPVSVWGDHFITCPSPDNIGGDVFHVIASKDSTDVQIDKRLRKTLKMGDTYEIRAPWNKSLEIATSNPSLVVQYTSGAGQSPSMNLVPARNWSSNDYIVYAAGDQGDAYMNVIIDTSLRSDLRVKGPLSNIPMNWKILPGGLSSVSLHLSQRGVYHIYHDNPLKKFTSVLYGKTSQTLFSFPAGLRWDLGKDPSCSKTTTNGGDKVDNDCDGNTDEELANGKDDDGDGSVDEDLATPLPNVTMPNDFVSPPLLSCGRSSNVADPNQPGFHPTLQPNSAQGVCSLRGKITVSDPMDTLRKVQGCQREYDRVWKVEDSCQNVITHTQKINIIIPEDPVLTSPDDITLFCRDKKYLEPQYTGEISRDLSVCIRNVTITHTDKYSRDCSKSEAKLERVWLVEDKCRANQRKTQVIKLLPKGSRRTTNYKTSFAITNEKFSSELTDRTSLVFKTLAATLENEMEKTFRLSKLGKFFVEAKMEKTFRLSKLGKFFVEAKVLGFSNGSVIAGMLVKIDMQAQVNQQGLFSVMNDTLSRGALGKYQVDPSSIRLQDFDECISPDLNKCHEKAKCTNTLGSYNCTCLDGYLGDGFLCQAPPSIYYVDPPIVSSTEENVTLTCLASGLPDPTLTWVTPDDKIVNASIAIYEIEVLDDGTHKTRGKILRKDGSLLVFDTRVHDQGIYKCVAVNVMGKDERNVSLTVRKDIVEVDVAITLEEEVFDNELENKSSTRYQELEKKVEEELTALFQDIDGFERVDILGFVNGSVKVRFRVVVKVDKSDEKEPLIVAKKVGKTLRVNVKDGKIGSLKVKPTVEFREVPPPPVNLKSSDVTQTEAVITWSHPELQEMYAISGYSLQYKKFGMGQWEQFAFTGGNNHRLSDLEHDTAYLVRLKSENEFGRGIPSESLELQTEKKTNPAILALGIVVPLLILAMLAVAAVFGYRRWKRKKQGYQATDGGMPLHPVTVETQSQPAATNGRFTTFGHDRYAHIPGEAPNGASAMAIEASFSWREIPRDRVTLGKVLGEGEFGMVMKGELSEDDGRIIPCAVKKLKRAATESDFKDLLNELEIMVSVRNHPNLVNLIGACSTGGPLMILVEFAEHGNLLRYLRDHRKQNYEDMNQYTLEISSAERLRIACDVSNGMKHLAAMKCAHRDLAARNVLLGEGLVAKVSDFGLSRDIYTDNVYEKKTTGKLPAKWMAVESLEQGIYTSQSDVWSFGVLLWEIETGGCAPYAGMVMSELLPKLKAGSRLDKPRYCTESLYSVMLRCWNANPKTRPKFDELSDELHRMYKQESEYLEPEDYRLEPNYVNTSVEDISSA